MDHHDLIILRVILRSLVAFLNLVMVVIVVLVALRHFLAILKSATVSPNIVLHQVLIELTLEHRGTLQVVVHLHAPSIILTCAINRHVLVQNRRVENATDSTIFAGLTDGHRARRTQYDSCSSAIRTVHHEELLVRVCATLVSLKPDLLF